MYATAFLPKGSVLAKIHMVTKRIYINSLFVLSSVLAKIHMVTKRDISI